MEVPYFKLCKEYAERFSDRWVILSAKYGFIIPEFIILQDYDVSFKNRQTQIISVQKLTEQAKELELPRFHLAISLGGQGYFEAAANSLGTLGIQVAAPLQGLRIGHRQKILRKALAGSKTLEYSFAGEQK